MEFLEGLGRDLKGVVSWCVGKEWYQGGVQLVITPGIFNVYRLHCRPTSTVIHKSSDNSRLTRKTKNEGGRLILAWPVGNKEEVGHAKWALSLEFYSRLGPRS